MRDEHDFWGEFDEKKMGHNAHYFAERNAVIDFRGPVFCHPTAQWGIGVKIVTLSHHIRNGQFELSVKDAPVLVDEFCWVTSFCILCDCHLQHHTILAIGSVANHIKTDPWSIYAGNPARKVAHWDGEKWVKLRR